MTDPFDMPMAIRYDGDVFKLRPRIEVLQQEGRDPFAVVITNVPENVGSRPELRDQIQLKVAGGVADGHAMPNNAQMTTFVELPNKNFGERRVEIRKEGLDNPFAISRDAEHEVSKNKIDHLRDASNHGSEPAQEGGPTAAPSYDLSKESFPERGPKK